MKNWEKKEKNDIYAFETGGVNRTLVVRSGDDEFVQIRMKTKIFYRYKNDQYKLIGRENRGLDTRGTWTTPVHLRGPPPPPAPATPPPPPPPPPTPPGGGAAGKVGIQGNHDLNKIVFQYK